MKKPYWETVPLSEMSKKQWEALCDGCGKCCLLKLEDEEDGTLTYTSIACRLFDDETCRCMNYSLRAMMVEGCIVLSPESLPKTQQWLPTSCAYRRIAEGRGLASWHPLVSGSPHSVHEAGVSMQNATIPEYEVAEEDWYDHAIDEEV